jgi:hypothetical protein
MTPTPPRSQRLDNMNKASYFWFFVVVFFGLFSIFTVWALSGFVVYWYFPSATSRGTFGDMFGAINALFSGFAFFGLVIAIVLQKQELEEQRKEIRESRLAQQQSAEALKDSFRVSEFTAVIEALNHMIEVCNRRMSLLNPDANLHNLKTYQHVLSEREQFEEQLRGKIDIYLKGFESK